METKYKDKYLKYKSKYLELKSEIENEDKYNQIGGILFYNCAEFYSPPEYYCYTTREGLIDNLNNKLTGTNNPWNGTVLHELSKINYNMDRFDQLPELVKLILNIRPRPARILELLLSKSTVEFIKKILTTPMNNLTILQRPIKYTIENSINRDVIESFKIVTTIIETTQPNMWLALTKVLEFFSCVITNHQLKVLLRNYLPGIVDNFNSLPIKFVLLDKIISEENYNIKNNQYTVENITTVDRSDESTKNFILKDFFSKTNTHNKLPPSALLLLSVKINPLINEYGNYYNNLLRQTFQMEGVVKLIGKCQGLQNQQIQLVQAENPQPLIRFDSSRQTDENHLTVALENEQAQQTNTSLLARFLTIINTPNTINPHEVNEPTRSLFTLPSLVTLPTIKIFKSIEEKMADKTEEIRTLEEEKRTLENKLLTASEEQGTFAKLIYQGSPSEKEYLNHQIRDKKIAITNTEKELYDLEIEKNIRDTPGVSRGLFKFVEPFIKNLTHSIWIINKDLCTGAQTQSNIKWRTFDKLLKIPSAQIFKDIFFPKKEIIKLIIQYLSPYSTFLPVRFNTYLYEILDIGIDEQRDFDLVYRELQYKIFDDFNLGETYHYSDLVNGRYVTNALTPPPVLLNRIIDELEQHHRI